MHKTLVIFIGILFISEASGQKEEYYSDTISSNSAQYAGKNNSLEIIFPLYNVLGFRYRNYKSEWAKEVYLQIGHEMYNEERVINRMNDTALFTFNPSNMENLFSLEAGIGKMSEFWGWTSKLSVSHLKREQRYNYDFLKYTVDGNSGDVHFDQLSIPGVSQYNYQTIGAYYQSLDFLRIGINTGVEAHVNVQGFLISLGTDFFVGSYLLIKEKKEDPHQFTNLSNSNAILFDQEVKFGIGYAF